MKKKSKCHRRFLLKTFNDYFQPLVLQSPFYKFHFIRRVIILCNKEKENQKNLQFQPLKSHEEQQQQNIYILRTHAREFR